MCTLKEDSPSIQIFTYVLLRAMLFAMLLAKRGRSERESKANEVERKGVLCSSRFFFHLRAAMKTHARPVPSPSARPSKARPSFSLSAIGGSHARRHWSRTVARSGFDASFCRLFPFCLSVFFARYCRRLASTAYICFAARPRLRVASPLLFRRNLISRAGRVPRQSFRHFSRR